MATDRASDQPSEQRGDQGRSPVSPGLRKQLHRLYERGCELARKDPPDHDYAHSMFSECVLKDPGNLEYVEAMLDNLQRKFGNNKKGAKFRGFGRRNPLKKAVEAEDWDEVFEEGIERLKSNPWDVHTLRALAYACQANHFNEVELRYLKNALDAKPKDVEVNKHCAQSLARMGQFDMAIACWHRVEEQDKGNVEARENISKLTLAKTLGPAALTGESTDARSVAAASDRTAATGTNRVRATPEKAAAERRSVATETPATSKPSETATGAGAVAEVSAEEFHRLQEKFAAGDAGPEQLVQMADRLLAEHRHRDAIKLLRQGQDVSGAGSLAIREKLEDAQVAMVRSQVAIAQQRAAAEETEEAAQLVEKLRRELLRQELQLVAARSERYPEDLKLVFQLAELLKRAGKYHEAAKQFQRAARDARSKPAAVLEMGECLQKLRRYEPARKCYQEAMGLARQGSEVHKRALYRVGVLAAATHDWPEAENVFSQLVQLDPEYRDAQARLDKIRQIDHNNESPPA